MLETLDHTIRIGSTPTFLYFDLYLHSAYYAAHYVYFKVQHSSQYHCYNIIIIISFYFNINIATFVGFQIAV